jgi:CTP:molybdopterin cytidylyltransferase MocA
MGSPKALLHDPDGRPFIVRIVQSLTRAGLRDIVVVSGRHHESIVEAVTSDASISARIVRNPDPSRGQLSSLWVGMDASIDAGTEGLLMTLVDVPMVAVSTIEAVVDAWQSTRAAIVRPAVGERHGHPVIFDRRLFGDLRNASAADGAKAVVHMHAADILNVPVEDRGCLFDVDTPADYERLRNV